MRLTRRSNSTANSCNVSPTAILASAATRSCWSSRRASKEPSSTTASSTPTVARSSNAATAPAALHAMSATRASAAATRCMSGRRRDASRSISRKTDRFVSTWVFRVSNRPIYPSWQRPARAPTASISTEPSTTSVSSPWAIPMPSCWSTISRVRLSRQSAPCWSLIRDFRNGSMSASWNTGAVTGLPCVSTSAGPVRPWPAEREPARLSSAVSDRTALIGRLRWN